MSAGTRTVLLIGNPNSGKTSLFNGLTGLSAKTGNYPGITVEHREGRATLDDGSVIDVVDVPGTYALGPRSDDEVVAVKALLGLLPGAPRPDVVVAVVDATQLERNLFFVTQLRELPLPLVVALTMGDVVAADGGTVDVTRLEERMGVPVVSAPSTRGGAAALKAVLTRTKGRAASLAASSWALPNNPPALASLVADPTALANLERAVTEAGAAAAARMALDAPTALGLLALGQSFAGSIEDGNDEGDRERNDDGNHKGSDQGSAKPTPDADTGRNTSATTDPSVRETALFTLGERGPFKALPLRLRSEAMTRLHQARYHLASTWAAGIVTHADASQKAPSPSPSPSTSPSGPIAGLSRSATLTRRLDAVALHPVFGPAIMVGVFLVLFQALFSWAEPLMDLIEGAVGVVGDGVRAVVPESLPLLRSLLVDGVVAGVGNVVVFVPQIAILFLFLAILEDSGYLARAAFLLDRLMKGVGLHGRAFVPMLSGFACAVPAIMATRTIENNKDRLVTILVTPLVSCSARLPVYALMIATVFSSTKTAKVFGVLEPGAVVMVSMYTLSLVAAVGMAAIFKRTILRSPTPPLVLELPAYRRPQVFQLYKAVWSRVKSFLMEAGTVILAITIVLWAMLTFPIDDDVVATRDAEVAAVVAAQPAGEARDAQVKAIEGKAQKTLVERSVAGRLGHAMEPLIEPLGFDWKIGVGILASFAAREVFVSTLGIVYGLGSDEEAESTSLRDAMRHDTHPDGSPVYTPLTGLSLMVFFVLAMQCMSTLAAVKRETRSWRWPIFQTAYMTVLAVLASFLVYQGGRLLGFGA